LSYAVETKREQTAPPPSKEGVQVPLLRNGTAILLELSLWISDMRRLF